MEPLAIDVSRRVPTTDLRRQGGTAGDIFAGLLQIGFTQPGEAVVANDSRPVAKPQTKGTNLQDDTAGSAAASEAGAENSETKPADGTAVVFAIPQPVAPVVQAAVTNEGAATTLIVEGSGGQLAAAPLITPQDAGAVLGGQPTTGEAQPATSGQPIPEGMVPSAQSFDAALNMAAEGAAPAAAQPQAVAATPTTATVQPAATVVVQAAPTAIPANVALAAQEVAEAPQRPVNAPAANAGKANASTAVSTEPKAESADAKPAKATETDQPVRSQPATGLAAIQKDPGSAETVPVAAASDATTSESGSFSQALGTATATGSTDTGSATTNTARPMAMPVPPAEQIAAQVQRGMRGGNDRITIHLSPEDLGAVEVTLRFDEAGKVKAAVAVDRSDTLELLQRDARGLERALQDAGLKTDGSSLSFSLRDDGRQGGGSQRGFQSFAGSEPRQRDRSAPASVVQGPASTNNQRRADGALDIRV